ncbi:MAG: hypothetical protein ABI068_09235 [Ktedonobacterales bacterium]
MRNVNKRWWIPLGAGALVAVVIAVVAFGRYATHDARYIASEAVAITATTPGATSSYGAYLETQAATEAAQSLTMSTALTNAAFDAAALAQLRTTSAYTGDASLHSLTAAMLGQTLSAQHQGAIFTLAAAWATQTGVQAIVTSAVTALSQAAIHQALPGVGAANAPAGTTYGAIPQPDTLTVGQDQNDLTSAQQILVTRIGLGIAFGLLLGFALAWLLNRRSNASPIDGSAQSQSLAAGDARPAR